MKKTNRVRSHDGGFAAVEQSKRKPRELAITVFDFEGGTNILQQNLSTREAAAIERACKKTGLTLKRFIKTAIDGAVTGAEDIPPVKTSGTKKQPGMATVMTTKELELFDLAILRIMGANRTRFGLSAENVRLLMAKFGFPNADRDMVLDRINFLSTHPSEAPLCVVMGVGAKANRYWRITKQGLDYLDKLEGSSKPSIEYAGKNILSNNWLKLGLSREELHALHLIARDFEQTKHRTVGRAAAFVLTAALMHWDRLYPLVLADQRYSESEGFLHWEIFCSETISKKFKMPNRSRRPRK